ncbi:MAG: helix-turn-helix transcriptional regulator [Oscillospiraceae bacterium]|nr:helix-turn-helix transcriptional regulator [Oscillospiraceae bacterium]
MAKKVGTLIKEARTEAGLTQEQLARKVKGVSASDISKAERGELDLTQAALKEIAKATGVTQASLINAAKGSSSSKKTSSTAKKTSSSSKKTTSSSSKTSMKVSSTEKKLVELYRKADSDTKKAAMNILKGESSSTDDIISNLLENAMEMLGGK